ncbi:putative protein phosphatase inhibitor [Trypanosoma conorhini]|uniref:Protein phosphatase inhibitor 2 (IPP-2) n=1 Tax=Trypanosoma conorhini TaxID=83891 RepID=A0A3S5ITH0_9TRYP|nr:putative protein phosphatase inhibitor [Trypanosoma conorhini]RNF17832.1 putative protein phosphatase inhibitor [Trypanosoma conorhini]
MTCRKHVVWDENNLEQNEEYRRLHPVTMRITEPKTPYEYAGVDEEGNFSDETEPTEGNGKLEEETLTTWDPKVNALAKEVKEGCIKGRTRIVAPISSSGRPMLSAAVTSGKQLEEEHDEDFRRMRKAVYADEGARFKALLSKQNEEEAKD